MPFAPSPTDGSIPTDLVLLAAERAVTVTREEHHQDVLSGRTGRAVVELRPCTIASGKHAGQDGLEVVLDGRRVGELTRLMAQRYRPMVDHLTAGGYRAGCEAFLQDDARGTQVELRLPAGPRTAGSGRRPRSVRPGPAPSPTTSLPRTAADTGADDRHRRPPTSGTGGDLAACSGGGRGDRDTAARIRPRQRRPGRPAGYPLATADGRRGRLLPDLPATPVTSVAIGRRVRRGAGGRACPPVDRTSSAPGGDLETVTRAPATASKPAPGPSRPHRSRPVATRTTAAACRSRATSTVRAAVATGRRT